MGDISKLTLIVIASVIIIWGMNYVVSPSSEKLEFRDNTTAEYEFCVSMGYNNVSVYSGRILCSKEVDGWWHKTESRWYNNLDSD